MKGAYFEKERKCYVSLRSGRVVCPCGRGGASEHDGKCTTCRGGITAFEAQAKAGKTK